MEKKDFIWKMGGQQGQGVESCGEILGRVLAQEGYSLFSQRLFASRIKGGHTTIALRIATKEIATIGEHVDCLVALDQETIDLHGKEICEGGVIIADDAFKPKWEAHTGRIFLPLPITEMAKKYGSMQMKKHCRSRYERRTARISGKRRSTALLRNVLRKKGRR
ncbi:MAG: 2-oxoacid:acceptor oxidoreductase family protein [Dialister invisus]